MPDIEIVNMEPSTISGITSMWDRYLTFLERSPAAGLGMLAMFVVLALTIVAAWYVRQRFATSTASSAAEGATNMALVEMSTMINDLSTAIAAMRSDQQHMHATVEDLDARLDNMQESLRLLQDHLEIVRTTYVQQIPCITKAS